MIRALVETAARHIAIDYLRSSRAKKEILTEDASLADEFHREAGAEAHILRMEEKAYRRMLLERLREKDRITYEILVRVEILGIPSEEVALEFRITRKNVYTRIWRARKWLRAEMARLYDEQA